MHVFLYYLVLASRIIFAPLILIWPTTSIIVSFLLDAVDADFAHHVVSKVKYQITDKILDSWVFIFELIIAWKMLPEFKHLLLFLFLWRSIGTFVFYIFKNRKIFLIFGNYFEILFFVFFFKDYLPKIDMNYLILIAVVIKAFQEWFIHVADLSVRENILGKKRQWRK